MKRTSGQTTGLAWTSGLWILAMAFPCQAQELTVSLGDGGSIALTSIQLLVLVSVLSILPGLAIMITCFPFLVTVLSILRQAIGLQQSPPNMLIVSLALFLTYFVMEPVFSSAWQNGVVPFSNGEVTAEQAFEKAMKPFRVFMSANTDPDTFAELAAVGGRKGEQPTLSENSPASLLIPSFMLSEIKRAFQIGFLIYLPFLIIDMVVAAVLMSMGMMMVPPAIVSLPFKLGFFVIVDGWSLVAQALVRSYF